MTTALKARSLGKSGIAVTEIGMGLWAAGGDQWGPTDDRAVLDAIDHALDAGITFFDTADVYGAGHSEELLGQAMRGRRDAHVRAVVAAHRAPRVAARIDEAHAHAGLTHGPGPWRGD